MMYTAADADTQRRRALHPGRVSTRSPAGGPVVCVRAEAMRRPDDRCSPPALIADIEEGHYFTV
jgi:hypothetical protein